MKLANPIGRSTVEWIGRTADSKPPAHVRLRIFERSGGICHISKRKIEPGEPWDLEHVIRLADGGENREANLRPALRDKHLIKTAAENTTAAPIRARKASHVGVRTAPVKPLQSAPFPISERAEKRQPKPALPPRKLYEDAR